MVFSPRLLALNLGDAAPVEDFIGPLIVANVPGKGRGVLVQRDVHRGGGVIRIMLNSRERIMVKVVLVQICYFAVHVVLGEWDFG